MSSLAGSFLIAKSSLRDPNFRHAVVLLLQHDENGAVGLVVNRPSKSENLPFPLYTGGPCHAPGFLLLHGHPEWMETDSCEEDPSSTEIAPGIYLGTHACLVKAMGEEDRSVRLRLFRGYAGWAPDQLEDELATGAWGIVRASAQFLFHTPIDELWERLAPPSIPQPSLN